MATSLHHLVRQEPEALLALEPEELAGHVLRWLVKDEDRPNNSPQAREVFLGQFRSASVDVRKVLTEAWVWLEREGCIAPHPDHLGSTWVFVTRRGKRLAESGDTLDYKRANLLPKEFLHPVIAQRVWSAFIRGEYDSAVFEAFKQVEVAVRDAGSFSAGDLGVTLMRDAFNPNTGPLTDKNAEEGERQALRELFSGAIGSYKNPHSHRNVALTDPQEAAEMIILASHLLKIVDSRNPKREAEPDPAPSTA